jgi:hypothetical protein
VYRITAFRISSIKVENLVESVNEVKRNNGIVFFENDMGVIAFENGFQFIWTLTKKALIVPPVSLP